MRRGPDPAHPRAAAGPAALLTLAALVFGALLAAPAASASAIAQARPAAPTPRLSLAERVQRYWTPERMRNARPLELTIDASGHRHLHLGKAEPLFAGASFRQVATPEEPPYIVNGRVFIRRGRFDAFCSGTAIDSPSRRLVLTAGHCVNSGPLPNHPRRSNWFRYSQFVPAYTGGTAPFGVFVATKGSVRAPREWVKTGNPDFDLGIFLTRPNAEGVALADAVGGGAKIVLGLSREQKFKTFGYPGRTKRMQMCQSPYIGDDALTYSFPGPPTMGIRCHWAPGASGGGWLIGDGSEINGVNSYLHLNNRSRTYGPYFNQETVGKLVGNK